MNESTVDHTTIHLAQYKRAKILKCLAVVIGLLGLGLGLSATGLSTHDSPGAIFSGMALYLTLWGLLVAGLTFFLANWACESLFRFIPLLIFSVLVGLAPLAMMLVSVIDEALH